MTKEQIDKKNLNPTKKVLNQLKGAFNQKKNDGEMRSNVLRSSDSDNIDATSNLSNVPETVYDSENLMKELIREGQEKGLTLNGRSKGTTFQSEILPDDIIKIGQAKSQYTDQNINTIK